MADTYTTVKKRSVHVAGFKTSVSVEDAFWFELKRIKRERHMLIGDLIAEAAEASGGSNLSSAIRQYVLFDLRSRAFPAMPAALPVLNDRATVQP